MFVSLFIQHAKRMSRIMLSSVAYPALQYHPWPTPHYNIIRGLPRITISSVAYPALQYHPWPTPHYNIIRGLPRTTISSVAYPALQYLINGKI